MSAAAVAAAGIRLARDGDVLAEGSGLGGMWMGAIVLAGATSLPELTTGINAVLRGQPDLALGDVFGACMANMAILATADLAMRGPRILTRVAINQALIGGLGICMAMTASIGIVLTSDLSLGAVGLSTLVTGLIYASGMRLIHLNRDAPPFASEADNQEPSGDEISAREMRIAVIGFLISAAVIFAATPKLIESTSQLAVQFGISEGFAGMIFLALTTTLPEASVTIGSLRAGAYSMAVGNLFGSNCFNLATLPVLDVLDGTGALLDTVAPGLALAGLFATLLMGLAVVEVLNKSEQRIWILEPGPAFMIAVYFAGLAAVNAAGVMPSH